VAMSRDPPHRSAIAWSLSRRCLAVIDSGHSTAMTGQRCITLCPFSHTGHYHAHHWYVLCSTIAVRRSAQLVTIESAQEAAMAYMATTDSVG
jgi:hypothetical protein